MIGAQGLPFAVRAAEPGNAGRILVVYYSRRGENYAPGGVQLLETGHTERFAKIIGSALGVPTYGIETAVPYPENYRETTALAKMQLMNGTLPELSGRLPDLKAVDLVFLGHPVWWSTLPPPVRSFLEKTDLSGKKIVHFATHEGSGFGSSEADLRRLAPRAQHDAHQGLAVRGSEVDSSVQLIADWAHDVVDKASM